MELLNACNLTALMLFEDNSVDAVVTDPPYGLKFMGKRWDYDVPSVDLWREVIRVLKPGGHLLSFGGTRTYHRMVVAIEDAGFEIRDQIQWIYGSGFPKSHNLDGIHEGWGTALKPANEPIVLARKPLEQGLTVAQNVLKWGTGALNVDASRIEAADQAVLDAAVKRMTGNATQHAEDRQFLAGTKTIKPNSAQGRWPSNVLLDEQSAQVLDEQSGGTKGAGYRSEYVNGENKNKELPAQYFNDSGGASRFFYVAKASKRERNAGLEGMPEQKTWTDSRKPNSYDLMTMKRVNPKTGELEIRKDVTRSANHHPTVKPIKLMQYLIKLITPPNGTVLDPFMGSGSTGVAAKQSGYGFTGIELDEDYFKIASRRLSGQSK